MPRLAAIAEPEQPVYREPIPTPPDERALERLTDTARILGHALSARAILTLALIGAFVLGVLAMMNPTSATLWVLIAYAALTILPCVYLESSKRRG